MRLFLAIDIPKELQERIKKIQEGIDLRLGRFAILNSRSIHLTLKFLGDVSETEMSFLQDRLAQISFSSFQTKTTHMGVFPSVQNPRVLWLGVEPVPELMQLSSSIETKLSDYPSDHSFKPHLTLARIKHIPKENLKQLLEKSLNVDVPAFSFQVSEFT
ncbi:RNA 2',3'-cyclic phosphodiesterase, partial [Candidatus Woesearchaeota archaeon]|nr:RNA 2',3'-cyclic phosphodiesterase [Candidatus Woesearchaeota archaeon]